MTIFVLAGHSQDSINQDHLTTRLRQSDATKANVGHTAVHKAAWYGKEAVMRFLIEPRGLGGLGLWRCLGLR